MKISNKNLLIKWAYLPNTFEDAFGWPDCRKSVPDQVSLCLLFWRSLFVPPAFLFAVTVVSLIALAFSPIILGAWFFTDTNAGDRVKDGFGNVGDWIEKRGLIQLCKSWKRKACPLITIESDDSP